MGVQIISTMDQRWINDILLAPLLPRPPLDAYDISIQSDLIYSESQQSQPRGDTKNIAPAALVLQLLQFTMCPPQTKTWKLPEMRIFQIRNWNKSQKCDNVTFWNIAKCHKLSHAFKSLLQNYMYLQSYTVLDFAQNACKISISLELWSFFGQLKSFVTIQWFDVNLNTSFWRTWWLEHVKKTPQKIEMLSPARYWSHV